MYYGMEQSYVPLHSTERYGDISLYVQVSCPRGLAYGSHRGMVRTSCDTAPFRGKLGILKGGYFDLTRCHQLRMFDRVCHMAMPLWNEPFARVKDRPHAAILLPPDDIPVFASGRG